MKHFSTIHFQMNYIIFVLMNIVSGLWDINKCYKLSTLWSVSSFVWIVACCMDLLYG